MALKKNRKPARPQVNDTRNEAEKIFLNEKFSKGQESGHKRIKPPKAIQQRTFAEQRNIQAQQIQSDTFPGQQEPLTDSD